MIIIVCVCDAMYIAMFNDAIFIILRSPYIVYMYNVFIVGSTICN